MSGAARTEYKHAIAKLSTKNLASFPPPAAWNTYGMRRSLTIRATKAFSDATLAQLLARAPGDARLQARIAAQQNWKCNDCGNVLSAAFEVDHIVRWSTSLDDSDANLQVWAICSHQTFQSPPISTPQTTPNPTERACVCEKKPQVLCPDCHLHKTSLENSVLD